MSTLELTSKERSLLRSAAHHLKPVVQIGDKGLSEAVMTEIDNNLTAHSLIKVKVAGDDRQARLDMIAHICDTLSCAPVHHLGKTLILYRPGQTKGLIQEKPDEFAPENQRSYRKPSAPYVPKKQAAEGLTAPKRRRKPSSATKTTTTKARPAHGIPVRTQTRSRNSQRVGSSLSLRSGRRSRKA